MNRLLLVLVALVGALVGGSLVWGYARHGDEALVRRTLVAHPDILTDAMAALQEREQGKLVAAAGKALTVPVGNAYAGNPRGDVSVVEFFDYNCGYCRASLPVVAALVKADPNVRIVYRELPVLAPSSQAAARANAAAAARTGVDLSAAASAQNDAEITRNLKAASDLGLTGTPSWVIGNRVLSGALPLEELQKAIATARGH